MDVKTIEGFEDYIIYNTGKVFSKKSNVFLRPGKSANKLSKQEHLHVVLCKNGKQFKKYISRLVAEAFIPNPSNLPIVHHKNNDPTINDYWNLEWVTHSENTTHGIGVKVVKILNSKVVGRYNSVINAAQSCGANNHGNISNCLAGKRKSAYGYTWKRGGD